jgi:hypothetical protein
MYLHLMYSIFLFIISPLITLIFGLGEYFKWWDNLSGRSKALLGFDRLQSVTGFPRGFLYNDEQDKPIFKAVERRIAQNTRDQNLRQILAEGHRISLITVVGEAQAIRGVPQDWKQEARCFYPAEQPVLVGFNVSRQGSDQSQPGQGIRACTLGDLRDWLNEEKEQRKFWVGTVATSCLSIGCILLRLSWQQ